MICVFLFHFPFHITLASQSLVIISYTELTLFWKNNNANTLLSARLSVIVMPHYDAASNASNHSLLTFPAFSGCRIGVWHDR